VTTRLPLAREVPQAIPRGDAGRLGSGPALGPPNALPLAGVRVIDLTKLLPGPLATRHLMEMGAEVTKIEGPARDGQDDGTRTMTATRADREAGRPGLTFRALNDGKRLLELDLRTADGRDTVLAMVREADLLVEGFRPGVMERLGLGWATLHAANPKLVMCAISGYGQANAWSHRAGARHQLHRDGRRAGADRHRGW
jgi:alpha-methylacyl-CoA racemase